MTAIAHEPQRPSTENENNLCTEFMDIEEILTAAEGPGRTGTPVEWIQGLFEEDGTARGLAIAGSVLEAVGQGSTSCGVGSRPADAASPNLQGRIERLGAELKRQDAGRIA